MSSEIYLVVADKFHEFTLGKKAITVSQLTFMLKMPAHLLPGTIQIVPGQGVSDQAKHDIVAAVDATDPDRMRWDVDALRALPAQACSRLSHKHKPSNTIIAAPQQVDEDIFTVDLRIDPNCELMDDHQTGQHVQGMILVEAARQAFLAVTEEFFLTVTDQKTFFVLNSMTTEFLGFVFPIPAQFVYRVVSKDINERRQKFSVEIDLAQAGETRMTTRFSFIAYPHRVIAEKEAELASTAANIALQHREAATNSSGKRVA